ncbi:hypothetical protein BG015_003218 [Linnemannia schmuckeri]|uniref:FAD-binding domain-containing protein n=1 Tax=Linnemannia schmuckeri TaxID=64567 RepID=A0A9P5RME8_9FUNG|nr:hypothetical protein BG015_003218 [Linnemannia schmuckeri]
MSFTSQPVPSVATDKPPHVLISGAGLAGLFLGILLEKAGIPYDIYERATEIKPLGTRNMYRIQDQYKSSPNILAAFEQLGLYEELLSFSKRSIRNAFYTAELEVIGRIESSPAETKTVGYDRILFARPELYNLLAKKTPSNKLHMAKKIVAFEQDQDSVTVTLGDGTTARGDILVGADGAHSAVRKHLYKILNKQDLLPESDTKEMTKGYISLVGTTDALDTAKHPGVLREDSDVWGVIGDKDTPYTWFAFAVPGNKLAWNVVVQLGITPIADEQFKASDWDTQQNQVMMDSIRHFKTPYGTLGDLFDATPVDCVSKVFFEDKLFETWNHGRVVVIGDAAHKLLPSLGAGAVNAMQDSVLLANHIYDIKPTNHENIKTALSEYKQERFNFIKDQYPVSHMSAKLLFGHTLWERILRYIVFNWLPNSMRAKQLVKDSAYRPQANFLPPAPKRGTMDIIPQQPSKRIQRKQEEAKKSATTAATL